MFFLWKGKKNEKLKKGISEETKHKEKVCF